MNFTPRRLLFKAWNTETKLLMRLNNIGCIKGELFKTNHILLQFTGLCDKQEEEIYEMDVILLESEKFIVVWDSLENGWGLARLGSLESTGAFRKVRSKAAIRLCNYFESELSADSLR
jgi:hypothetical protein